ncbi:MAG: hypothetical protein D6814_07340 [Calditrichaeota bacterium]|nr:MAG: hypothetical protein D6814_07340 [Calditrichota bacterium]
MDVSKLIFFAGLAGVLGVIFLFVKDRLQYFLVLTVAFAPSASAIIFYHFNGIYLVDFPLFLLFGYLLSQGKIRAIPKSVLIPATVWIFWSLITAANAQMEVGTAISEWTRHLRGYILFLCTASVITSPKRINGIVWALLGTLLFESLLGFYQWRFGPLGLSFLEERFFRWRVGATFGHPSMYADYLILLLPLVIRFFVFMRHSQRWHTAFYGGLLLFGSAGLYGSYARAEWVALAGALTLMVLYSLPRRKFWPRVKIPAIMIILAGTLFLMHYFPTIMSQFTTQGRKRAADIRWPLNYVALAMTNAHPIMGVGLGNYRKMSFFYVQYGRKAEKEFHYSFYELMQVVHNSYLLISSETGWPGLFIWLWFIGAVFWRGRRALKLKHVYLTNITIGLMAGLVAFFISVTVHPNISSHTMLMMVWMVSGILTGLSRIKLAPQGKLPQNGRMPSARLKKGTIQTN